MERKKLLIILLCSMCIIVLFVFLVNRKENKLLKKESANGIDYSDTTIVPDENTTDAKYNVKTEDGENVISYEVIDIDEENKVYTIRDSYGREIGNTTNLDEIRIYVENPEYSTYGPTIK